MERACPRDRVCGIFLAAVSSWTCTGRVDAGVGADERESGGMHAATSVMWYAEYDDLCRVKKPINETRQFKTQQMERVSDKQHVCARTSHFRNFVNPERKQKYFVAAVGALIRSVKQRP
jgi:hypothetical protein